MSVMIEQIFRTPQGAEISQFVKPSQIGVVPPEWRDCRLVKFHWPAYVWPGAYPIVYLTKDASALCPDCANNHLTQTLLDDPQWAIVGSYVNYEDQACYCDQCNRRVEPAYSTEEETTA